MTINILWNINTLIYSKYRSYVVTAVAPKLLLVSDSEPSIPIGRI